MKKFLIYIICFFLIGVGFSTMKLWKKSPESFRILIGQPTESPFRDNSVLVEYTGLPTVIVHTADKAKLRSEARIRYMRARRAAAAEFKKTWGGVGRPTVVRANITTFGGRPDRIIRRNERGSVSGELLRYADVENAIYTAWPMPEVHEGNPESTWKLPSVEEYFGRGNSQLKKRIEFANLALKNYWAEISHVHPETGETKTINVNIGDRGPNVELFKDLPRWDASRGTWKALGLEDKLKKPNDPTYTVELIVRLVPKPAELREKEEEDSGSGRLYSHSGGEKFLMPTWDESDKIATNP